RVLVDAEETWIQDPIDALVEGFMKTFNQTQPTVYHTLQMYRTDRLEYLKMLLQRAKTDSFICAVKLVRGAYMEKERKRAESKGLPSPILPHKQATDAAYDAALRLLLDSTENAAIFAGTHNEQSSQLLVDLMLEKGIAPKDPRFYFSQLLGMSDHLTFNLAQAGFNTAKYVPYGPVRELTPYLIRRAQENSAISGQSLRELELIEKELKRRKTAK
ncbi:MAG: proline dehydrogenase family protein, partial [Deltaproteobacteria bacterium]